MKLQLTADQSARKALLEAIVQEYARAYERAGEALKAIRDEQLYLDEFDTFEEYVNDRWGVSARRGYQLIEASEIAKRCEPVVQIPTERAARALSGLTPEQQIKVAKRVGNALKKGRCKNQKQSSASITSAIIDVEVEAVVGPRGGLYAQSQKAAPPNTPSKPCVPPSAREACAAMIESWYAEERARLNEYPMATPDAMVKRICALLRK